MDHSVLAHLGKSTITESTTNVFTFGLLNIRSINNKAPLIWDLLKDCKFDFFCLTETWQQHNDFSQLNQSIPPGFCLRLSTPSLGSWWWPSNALQ